MIFERVEYLERLRRTRERMAARGIDVLLLSDPGNINYLSGYDGWSFYVHQALLVAQDEEQPVWIGRGQDANAARVTTFLEPASIVPYPDDFVQSELKHPMDFVANQLKARGWDRAPHRRRDGQLLLHRRRLRVAAPQSARDPAARCQIAGQLGADRQVRRRDRADAPGGADRRAGDAGGDRRRGARGSPVRCRGQDLRGADPRHRRVRRHLSGDRAAAADRDRHLDPASHLGRRAVPAGHADHPGAGRLPQPLSLPHGAHGPPGAAAPAPRRHRQGRGRRPERRDRGGAARARSPRTSRPRGAG